MRKFLQEPLLHFAVLGVLLFVYFDARSEPAPATGPDNRIEITDADLALVIEQFKSVWRRPPSEQELSTLVDGTVREEVLVREALALGLDRGDAAIRNRLMLKMQFLTESAAQAMQPDDETLRAHLAAHPDTFLAPGRYAFDQVFLGQDADPALVADTLARLRGGADPGAFGVATLLPASMPLSTRAQVEGTFGVGMFDALDATPDGEWTGPVPSAFGEHLVRVNQREASRVPDFADIRDRVLIDWRRVQAEALAQGQYEVLRAGYDIVLPDAAQLRAALGQ